MAIAIKQNSHNDRLKQAVQAIRNAESQSVGNLHPDHPFVKEMRDFFEAEGVVWITVETPESTLATKNELNKGSDWRITSNLLFEKGLLVHALHHDSVLEIAEPRNHPDFNPVVDDLKNCDSQFIVCSPVQSHSRKFGVITLVNPENYFVETHDKVLFQLFLNALASQLYSSMVFNEMQVTDADLMVSRQQLLNSRNTLRTLFDNIPESFYLVDVNYQIRAINISRADRSGLIPKELVGKTCHEVLFGRKKPCVNCLVAETVKTGKAQYDHCHSWVEEKNPRDWDISSHPVFDAHGNVEQVILLEQDITEKRKLESEVVQSEKLVAVGQLAAGVAHEINNPLTSILANAQMLLLDLDPEQNELVESVKLIEMAGKRAKKVVENLQSMIRKEDFEFRYFDLNESIQNALFLISHEFISRQITIRFNRGESLPEIYGSEDHLQGVWINILMNSLEAIDTNKGEIKIETLYDEGKFYVEIKDTGMGISEENLNRIFEPFFTTKKSGKGTGLGLSLARRIIRAHGGHILVESAPGEGSRFTIMLPEQSEQDIKSISKDDLGLI